MSKIKNTKFNKKIDNFFMINKTNLSIELFLKYEKEVRKALYKKDVDRYWHSISVALTSVNLASIYGANPDECMIAGLLHDYCKCIDTKKMLSMFNKYKIKLTDEDIAATGCLHGFLAATVCKNKFNINNHIKNAIYYHTCGRPNMTILEKIVYIADFIEPLRKFRDKVNDIRNLAFNKNIDKAIVLASQMNIEYLVRNNKFIHSNTKKTLEYYKKSRK